MPTGNSKAERPLDFHHWLASRGMNPNRKRPLGRQAALLIEYRSYLEQKVGKENVHSWFEKYGKRIQQTISTAEKPQ